MRSAWARRAAIGSRKLAAREDAAGRSTDQRTRRPASGSRSRPATRGPTTSRRLAFRRRRSASLIYPDIPDNYRVAHGSAVAHLHRRPRDGARRARRRPKPTRSQQDRERDADRLKLEITRAYWAVITARESVDVVDEALARIEAQLRDVRNQLNVGLVPPSDVLSVEAQRARQQMLLIEARTSPRSRSAEFRRLVGLAPERPSSSPIASTRPPSTVLPNDALVDAATAESARAQGAADSHRRRWPNAQRGGRRRTAPRSRRPAAIDYRATRTRESFRATGRWKPSWDVGVK